MSSRFSAIPKQWLLRWFLITCFSFLLGTSFAGTAFADTMGPAISSLYPANGATVNQTKFVVSFTAHDNDLVNVNTVVMKVDGVRVNPNAQYGPIDESTDDYTTLDVVYPATLAPGLHTAEASVKDSLNNLAATSWSFTVTDPPKILSLSPANGATVVSRIPEIWAKLTSGDGIDPNSIVMTVNNTRVNAVLDSANSMIIYTPSAPMANETYYNIALQLKDTAGRAVSATWQFYINTFQEMTYAVNDDTCQKCHIRTQHPMNNCNQCHGINLSATEPAYPLDNCYLCHFNSTDYPAVYHPGGLPLANPPDHPVQITYSCTECHNRTWSGPNPTIPSIHNVFTTAIEHNTNSVECTTCHSASLTREHQRRKDDQGHALTCFTCHNSPDINVQVAIVVGDSNCGACHGATSHPEHNNGLDQYCQTCHSATIIAEPQFHAANDCSICHENDSPLVKYAISVDDTACFACHEQGHNVNFVQKTPVDIPLYLGFEWSQPQKTDAWADEPWFPADFKTVGARFLISSRRNDVTGTILFDWYTQNLTVNGWEKISGPDQGSDNFSLDYRKGVRNVNIRVYCGSTHDSGAPFVGYRVEIAYK